MEKLKIYLESLNNALWEDCEPCRSKVKAGQRSIMEVLGREYMKNGQKAADQVARWAVKEYLKRDRDLFGQGILAGALLWQETKKGFDAITYDAILKIIYAEGEELEKVTIRSAKDRQKGSGENGHN